MFGGGGSQVGANVVLSANTDPYNAAMQGSVAQTNQLAAAYDNLKAKIDRGFTHVEHVSFGVSAADIASLTAATVQAGRLQEQMRGLAAQNNVLNQSYGNGRARMAEYSRAVDTVRSSFGEATNSAAQLVQTISGFERGGSTQGLTQLAQNFERMSQTTGENASALAQSVLTLEQTMGNGLRSTQAYSDQLVSMAEASNTSAESLAHFASQIAPLGRQLNMTQSEITGFAAAFSKAGQDGYRASNVFSQMTSDIAQSLQTNSPRLAAYANLLGVTTQALKGMSGAAVTSGLFDAIGRRGSGSLQTLNELGYDGLNVTRVVSAVTQQSGGVGNYVRMANKTFGDNAASAGGQTAGQQFSKLTQDLEQSGEAIGSKFLPALQGVMTFVDKLALGVTQFMQGPGGDLVTVFAAVVAPVAALAGGLVSLHGAILPLMTLMALKRSGLGTGLVEGFRYGGRGPVGLDPRMADRPMVAKAYGAGNAVGAFGRMGGSGDRLSPRMRWVLGMDKVADAERGAAVGMAEGEAAAVAGPGMLRRGAGRAGWFLHRNLVVPQFEPLTKASPLDRQPIFGAAGGGGKAAESLAAAETGAAEASTGLKASLASLAMSVKEAGSSLLKGSGAIAASSDTMAKAQADAADATVASSAKASEASTSMAAATEEAAGATQAAAASIMAAARASAAAAGGGLMGTLKGAGSGALMAGGIGARGAAAGAMGLAGAMGPMGWGMLGLMAAPFLTSGMNKAFGVNSGSMGPGASDIMGTGLSFPVGGVVAPVAQSSAAATFNPMKPTAAQVYSAQQASDYTNQGVRNIKTADEAAAIYGPAWGQMAAGDQRSLANDLIKRLGPAGYTQFTSMLQGGKYSTYGAANAAAVAGKPGGFSMLYNTESQVGQGLTNPAGSDFRALANTLSANLKPGETRPFDLLQNPFNRRASSMDTTGFTGGGRFSQGLGYMNISHSDWGGFLPYGSKRTYGLTGQGLDFARSLYGGTPGASAQSNLGKLLSGMPKGLSGSSELSYLLNRLPKADLETALQAHQLAPTGNRTTDIKAVIDAMGQASKTLTSALHGLGLSATQQHELSTEDASNPAYYAQKLYRGGIGQRRLSQLYLQGGSIFPGTIDAIQAYGANQRSLLSPYLTSQQQLLGSNSGRPGVSGMNAGMINTPMGQFNGQFSLLGVAQGALRTGRRLDAMDQLSGDAKAMGNLSSAADNLEQGFTSGVAALKQYEMTLDQLNYSSKEFKQSMAWQAEQEKLMVSREKSDEKRQVGREEYSYQLQRKRAESDFQRSRRRAEADYNLQRTRAMADFSHQTVMMVKQSALSMHDIYTQTQSQGFTSAQFLLTNNAQQTSSLSQQESQLGTLRGMGLSTDSIQQLGLTGANNAQELNGLFQQIQQNPALIDQLNSAVKQRLAAAGGLATDASSMSYQEQVYAFNLSLTRGAEDFTKSMKRAHDDFDLQMHRSAVDFARQMGQQDADFRRQLGRQQKDYNTSVSHSWTSFNDQVSNSMKQMNISAGTLKDTMGGIGPLVKAFGSNSNIGKNATALQNAEPTVAKLIGGLNNLLNPKVTATGKNEPLFMRLLDMLTGKTPLGAVFGKGAGGIPPSLGSSGAGLPKGIAERMAADHPHSGWCLKDVADVLAAPHGAATAYGAWLGAKGHRFKMDSLIPPPIGAPVFFGPQYGNGDGHVAINAGYGMMWSEDSGDRWEKKPIWPGVLGWSSTLNGATVAPTYGQKGFAKGSWELPSDMIAQIHKGEMIIPAKVAAAVRGVLSKGQVAGMMTHSMPVVNHVDARSYSTKSETTFTGDINLAGVQNPLQLAQQAKAQARLKALAKR